ncbi:MarR family winged helix-turn-helix transcriptional regulator [Chitinophagales bacterium]|nr:MarR family winged helix-turn-helix transcriptional regulator [Chitinophagales bacterium]
MRKLHRMLNTAYMEKFRSFGLRGSMVSILFIIGKRPGVHQKILAESLVLDQSTISRDIKSLQKKGWLTISRGQDPRQSELRLTKEGCLLLEKVAPLWNELQTKVEHILGSFNIQHIDSIIAAIGSKMPELRK